MPRRPGASQGGQAQNYQPPQGYQPQVPAYGAGPYANYPQPSQGYGPGPALPYAGIGKRFVAYIVDGLIHGIGSLPGLFLFFIGGAIAESGGRDASDAGGGIALLGFLVLFAGFFGVYLFNIYLLGKNGATIGKRLMGIKVLDAALQPLGFGKAFLRELVKLVIANVCIFLLLWPLWDDQKQGLHDKLLNCHVYEA